MSRDAPPRPRATGSDRNAARPGDERGVARAQSPPNPDRDRPRSLAPRRPARARSNCGSPRCAGAAARGTGGLGRSTSRPRRHRYRTFPVWTPGRGRHRGRHRGRRGETRRVPRVVLALTSPLTPRADLRVDRGHERPLHSPRFPAPPPSAMPRPDRTIRFGGSLPSWRPDPVPRAPDRRPTRRSSPPPACDAGPSGARATRRRSDRP